jgi:hypothetical protein
VSDRVILSCTALVAALSAFACSPQPRQHAAMDSPRAPDAGRFHPTCGFEFAYSHRGSPESDVALIVGGYFTPDHIGPTAYEATLRRVHANPEVHLDVFEQCMVRASLNAEVLSSLHLPYFLQLLRSDSSVRVRTLAGELQTQYRTALERYRDPSHRHELGRLYRNLLTDDDEYRNFQFTLEDRLRALTPLAQ